MRSRLRIPALIAITVLPLAGCGKDGQAVSRDTGRSGGASTYTLAEAESRLEGTAIDVVRTGGEVAVASEISPAPALSQQYATTTSAEFGLLVFDSPRQAKAAGPSLAKTGIIRDGGAYTRAGNIVAVTPQGPKDRDAYAEIFALFRALGKDAPDSDLATGSAQQASAVARAGDSALGRTVTVRGRIGELLPNGGPAQAFFLGGTEPGDRLLVVPVDPKRIPAGATAPQSPGATPPVLEVRGTVRPVSELEGYAKAGGRSFLEIRAGRVALVAGSIDVVSK